MSRKAEKLLQKARQTKAGWSSDDLIKLYKGFGFEIRQAQGSHVVISHPKYEGLTALIAVHAKELSKAYVVKAVKNIDHALELEAAEQEENEEENDE
jgi:predicted RNA binding protein YcfA (HicA-like mRNA interferase family)